MARKQNTEKGRQQRLRRALDIVTRGVPPGQRQKAIDEAVELGVPIEVVTALVRERVGTV